MYSVEDLVAFVTIVEEGSVTGAAKTMDLDPATVSRRLSKLEAKLGVTLIQRSTRRMAITAEGSLFHTHAIAAIRLLRQAEQSVAPSEGSSSSGTAAIAIAAPSWLLQQLLVPAMQRLSVSQSATVELIATDTSDMLNGQAALSISVGQYAVASEYQVRLVKNHTVLCVSPAYLGRSGGISTPRDLLSRTCIAAQGHDTWEFHGSTDGFPSVSTGRDLICGDDATLLEIAKSGQGVVALNSLHAADALASGELIEVLAGQLIEADRNIYLHCDAKRYAMTGVEDCYKAIQQSLASQKQQAAAVSNLAVSANS